MPKISVLIATSDNDEAIRVCLSQLMQCYFESFEVVVVLNGDALTSRLTEEDFFKNGIDFRFFRSDFGGLSANLNFGLSKCRADLVARIDTDDLVLPHRFNIQHASLMANRDVSMICESHVLPKNGHRLITKDSALRLNVQNVIVHPSVMFRKADVMNAGGYRGFQFAQDYELWLRLVHLYGCKVEVAPLNFIYYSTSAKQKKRTESHFSSASYQLFYFLLTKRPSLVFGSIFSIFKGVISSARTCLDRRN